MELHLDPEGSWIIGKRNNGVPSERFLKEMAPVTRGQRERYCSNEP